MDSREYQEAISQLWEEKQEQCTLGCSGLTVPLLLREVGCLRREPQRPSANLVPAGSSHPRCTEHNPHKLRAAEEIWNLLTSPRLSRRHLCPVLTLFHAPYLLTEEAACCCSNANTPSSVQLSRHHRSTGMWETNTAPSLRERDSWKGELWKHTALDSRSSKIMWKGAWRQRLRGYKGSST